MIEYDNIDLEKFQSQELYLASMHAISVIDRYVDFLSPEEKELLSVELEPIQFNPIAPGAIKIDRRPYKIPTIYSETGVVRDEYDYLELMKLPAHNVKSYFLFDEVILESKAQELLDDYMGLRIYINTGPDFSVSGIELATEVLKDILVFENVKAFVSIDSVGKSIRVELEIFLAQ